MRTIIDLPEEQVQRLGELCRREGMSRAEAVRRAVTDYLNAHGVRERQEAFGMWRERRVDGLEYERRLRREWP
ncbi:MAG: ribbon-helix-helix domain-containing protein [Acidobacteria bacterium]|nr:ribbon-helix-helix domain-containing protein [Acidobacteriota bacterium]